MLGLCKGRIKMINENEAKVKQFFERIASDLKTKENVKLLLYTYVNMDGLGDAAQIGYLQQKLKEKLPDLNVTTLLGCDELMLQVYHRQICELAHTDEKHILIREANDHRLIDVQKCGFDYLIQYPFPNFSYETNALAINEMGKFTPKCMHTGESNQGIGYGIPTLPSPTMIDTNPQWLISAKPYTLHGEGALSDFSWQNSIRRGDYNSEINKAVLQRNVLMYDRILYMQKQFSVQPRWINGTLKKYKQYNGEKDSILDESVGADAFAQIVANKAGGVIVCGGEGLFCQCLAMPHEVPVVFACRYDFQYREIAASMMQLMKIETASLKDLTSKTKQQYRIFRLKDQLIYAFDHEHAYFDLLKQTPIKITTDETVEFNNALSSMYLPMLINMRAVNPNTFPMPQIFKHPNDMLPYHLQLKQKLKERNWFHLIA